MMIGWAVVIEFQSVTPWHHSIAYVALCIVYVLYMHCMVNNSEISNSDEIDISNAVLLLLDRIARTTSGLSGAFENVCLKGAL